jgi:hypothetical protein
MLLPQAKGAAMRRLRPLLACGLCFLALLGCSAHTPPIGRWEGAYEASDLMAVIRLEISPKGEIFLSAPDALDIQNASANDRLAMHQKLAEGLVASWSGVQPRTLDFDGHEFRKPGGIAPQLEWNADSKQMTAILYFGMRSGLRVPLHSVETFSADPS